jgi:hypothetical protein
MFGKLGQLVQVLSGQFRRASIQFELSTLRALSIADLDCQDLIESQRSIRWILLKFEFCQIELAFVAKEVPGEVSVNS